ncbi:MULTISPECIES: hypothetical protein [Streptomyces]|uniref:hypothetical protein n=1 Tax=Streptomyces TaxID=1883 RepID=UPI002E17C30E|nr:MULTISPECIES: hypothetical protein [unclassified Streptomyces]
MGSAQFAERGITSLPEKGWEDELIARWEAAEQGHAPPGTSTPPPGTLDFG